MLNHFARELVELQQHGSKREMTIAAMESKTKELVANVQYNESMAKKAKLDFEKWVLKLVYQ